jgi:hypothetical protein
MTLLFSLVVLAVAYTATLVVGHAILVPVAAAAAVFAFRTLMREGRRLEPFAAVLVLFAVQNIAAGVLGGGHAPAGVRVAVSLSAVLPACVILAGWSLSPVRAWEWLTLRIRGTELWLLAVSIGYALLVTARWITAPLPLSAAFGSLRNDLTPAYGILTVVLLPPELRPTITEIVTWLRRWGLLVALAGFVELAALGDRFWVTVADIGATIHVKELSVAHRDGFTVPADFYTYFGHHYFRRLVSVYGDAITTGYYLALGFLAALFGTLRARVRWAYAGVLAVAIALSFVKGGFQVVLVGVIVALVLRTRGRVLFEHGAIVVMVACVLCVVGTRATEALPFQSSVQLHVSGLNTAVREVTREIGAHTVWGEGVGMGGAGSVFIQRHAGNLVTAANVPGLDNGAGTILVDTGVLGLAGVLGLFALLIPACARRARDNRAATVATIATVALLVNFLMQEHALALLPSLPFWVLATIGTGAAPDDAPLPVAVAPARRASTKVQVAGFDPKVARRRRRQSGKQLQRSGSRTAAIDVLVKTS